MRLATTVPAASSAVHAQKPVDAEAGASSASAFRGASVHVEAVSKAFGAVRAVDDVTLDVHPGEFVALLGPSGSGKTTLFMTIAGFERTDSGRIRIADRDVTRAPAYKRGLGMVFQRYALFPHLSVGENVAYPLKMRGVRASKRRDPVREALELVDLGNYADRRVDQLSGGQQQRVALARALVFRPPVLLMDEPLGALDRKLREQVQLEIRRLHRDLGTTILYVTHDQEEALVMADRIAVMRDGRLLQIGTPGELYDEPVDAFVADFLGRTNFVPAVLRGVEGDRARVTVADHGSAAVLPAASPLRQGVAAGTPVRLAVRPEHIALGEPSRGLTGTVTEVIFTGATTTFRVDLGLASVMVQKMTDAAVRALREGTLVGLSWPAERAHVYPTAGP